MNYRYSLIALILMLLPLCAQGYQIDYDSFPSCSGIMTSNDYALETEIADLESGSMTDGSFQITSSLMLNSVVNPTANHDLQNPAISCELYQNYPNPFNPDTTIHFSLKTRENVKLSIYNLRGQLIKTLADSPYDAGHHKIKWTGIDHNGRVCASGVYKIQMKAGNTNHFRKIVLLK